MNIQLYINGEEVELPQLAQVAINKQVMLTGDIAARQLDFTPRFTLPATGKNRRIMDQVNAAGNMSLRPYIPATCSLVANGVPLVGEGRILVSATKSRAEYECIILAGNDSIFKVLEGKKLRDLYLVYEEFIFTGDEYYARLGDNRDVPGMRVFFPVLDTGQGLVPASGTANAFAVLDYRWQVPAIMVPFLVEKILEEAGLQEAWDNTSFFQSDALFNEMQVMLLPPSDQYYDDIQSIVGQLASITPRLINMLSGTTTTYLVLEDEIKDDNGNVATAAGPTRTQYTCPLTAIYTFDFSIILEITQSSGAHIREVILKVMRNGSLEESILLYRNIWGVGIIITQNSEHQYTFDMGDVIEFILESTDIYPAGSGQYGINKALITMSGKGITTFYENPVIPNEMLPDVTQVDFLKQVLQTFGLIPQYRNGAPYFATMQDVLTRSFGVDDWSDRLNYEANESYSIGSNYGRRSLFKYKYNSDDEEEFADYEQELNNENYNDEKTVIESKVTASAQSLETITTYNANTGDSKVSALIKIPYYGDDDLLTNIKELRIIQSNITDVFVGALPGVTGIVYIGAFLPLYWEELVSAYYPALMRIAERPVLKQLCLYLSVRDIAMLDHFRLKYFKQFQAVYYLQKITNFLPGRPVMCELIEAPATTQNVCPDPVINNVVGFFGGGGGSGFEIRMNTENDYYIQSYILTVEDSMSNVIMDNVVFAGGNIAVYVTGADAYTYVIQGLCGNGEKNSISGVINYTPYTVTSWT